jgi:hypothetical protein
VRHIAPEANADTSRHESGMWAAEVEESEVIGQESRAGCHAPRCGRRLTGTGRAEEHYRSGAVADLHTDATSVQDSPRTRRHEIVWQNLIDEQVADREQGNVR